MAQLLVNNIEQSQPDGADGTRFHLFTRGAEDPSRRNEIIVHGFDPYFYAPEEEVESDETFLLNQQCINKVEYGDYEGLHGESLAKVYPPYPQDTEQAREYFSKTWASDVPFTRRFRIDTGIRAYIEVPDKVVKDTRVHLHYTEISPITPDDLDATPTPQGEETALPDVEPRVVTVDIEVDDRGDGFPAHGEERILSIVAHDSYHGDTIGFLDTDGGEPPDPPDNIYELRCHSGEAQMLTDFQVWFADRDPDLVTGWNVDDFDIPYLIERISEVSGPSKNDLSPMGWAGVTDRGDARIKGRTVYDMLTVYRQNQFTKIRSYSLDYVANLELGKDKVEFEGSYYDLYERDKQKFMEYNAEDVLLCVQIDDKADVIEFRDILRREVGVDFGDSYYNKDFVDMMCRRKLKRRGVIGPKKPDYGDEPDSDYEGAFVFDAYEGVTENVVGIDLASLYPYTMAMLNASPETKVADPAAAGTNITIAKNGQAFTQAHDGMFKELVDDAIALKSDYKQKRNAAETDKEYKKWDNKYNVAKTLTNSIYGVTGWERFFLYDEDVAEAVTLTGQWVIKETAHYIEDMGYEVIYGDTDSVYVGFPSEWHRDECLDRARELVGELNNSIYPDMAEQIGLDRSENLWEIEVEAYMEKFFQAGKKKRYAYVATWKDGRDIEDPEPTISGFSSKRSDSAEITVETEQRVLDAILGGRLDRVSDIVYEAATEITATDVDWERIGIPGGMSNKITDRPELAEEDNYYAVSCDDNACYPQSAHPRAAYNANQILNTDFGKGDKPMRVYVEPKVFDELGRQINVIGFESETDLEPIEGDLEVDVSRMLTTTIKKPLRQVLSAVDVDVDAAVRGQEQASLGAF